MSNESSIGTSPASGFIDPSKRGAELTNLGRLEEVGGHIGADLAKALTDDEREELIKKNRLENIKNLNQTIGNLIGWVGDNKAKDMLELIFLDIINNNDNILDETDLEPRIKLALIYIADNNDNKTENHDKILNILTDSLIPQLYKYLTLLDIKR